MLIIIKFIFPSNFNALAIWPFIFLRGKELKNDEILLNHEKIHLKQQKELLWIFFFMIYFIEFLAKIVIYKRLKLAYRNISFEREAYLYERDFNYTKIKPLWSFINFLSKDHEGK
jgi:hypothetical protein